MYIACSSQRDNFWWKLCFAVYCRRSVLWQYLPTCLVFCQCVFSSQRSKRKQKFGTCVEPRKQFRVCCVAEAQARCFELRNSKPQFALAGSVAELLIRVKCFCAERWLVRYQMQIWQEPMSRAAWLEGAEEQTCHRVWATAGAFPRKRLKRRQIVMERQAEPSRKEGICTFAAWSRYCPLCYCAGWSSKQSWLFFFPFLCGVRRQHHELSFEHRELCSWWGRCLLSCLWCASRSSPLPASAGQNRGFPAGLTLPSMKVVLCTNSLGSPAGEPINLWGASANVTLQSDYTFWQEIRRRRTIQEPCWETLINFFSVSLLKEEKKSYLFQHSRKRGIMTRFKNAIYLMQQSLYTVLLSASGLPRSSLPSCLCSCYFKSVLWDMSHPLLHFWRRRIHS